MKKSNLFITALLVVAATTVAMVSCKKDNQEVLLNNTQSVKAFTPPVVDDMNAYLKNFKQKMKESQNTKNAECLSLEEAAWHLSSLANYDFANANVEFNDIRFDTLYSTVTITGSSVLLSNLAAVYQSICTDIERFYHSIMLDEKHFRFINVSVFESGEVVVSITTTYNRTKTRFLNDTCWYLEDVYQAYLFEDSLFNFYPTYPAATLGATELERVLNLTESHPLLSSGRIYYTPTTDTTFYYRNEIDPFGSPNYLNSRLYANHNYLNPDIKPIMIYLFDSYAGLGYANRPEGEDIVQWTVTYDTEKPIPHTGDKRDKDIHHLKIQYGQRHEMISEPGSNDF